MSFKAFVSAATLAVISGAVSAQEAGDVSVGLGLSNFGASLEGAYYISPDLRARGALIGGFGLDFEDTDDGDTVEGEFDLGGAALLADYYPLQNGWRISGGLFISNTELNASGDVEVGDPATTTAASVSAKFENEIAPMITTGYDWSFGNGWAFTSEVGVIFNGGIDVTYEADDASFQSDIDDDADVQDAIEDAGDITALPFLSLGVSYKY